MRAWLVVLVGAAALASGPAQAKDRHGLRHGIAAVSVSYGYPFGWYGHPRHRPWGYYPSYYGVGVHVSRPYRVRRARTERAEASALELYVYPAGGQSERQLADDRYDCHVWAADRSGHDPTLGAGSRRDAEAYTRAFTACMEGRDYVVK